MNSRNSEKLIQLIENLVGANSIPVTHVILNKEVAEETNPLKWGSHIRLEGLTDKQAQAEFSKFNQNRSMRLQLNNPMVLIKIK